jgi:hypothetical protein
MVDIHLTRLVHAECARQGHFRWLGVLLVHNAQQDASQHQLALLNVRCVLVVNTLWVHRSNAMTVCLDLMLCSLAALLVTNVPLESLHSLLDCQVAFPAPLASSLPVDLAAPTVVLVSTRCKAAVSVHRADPVFILIRLPRLSARSVQAVAIHKEVLAHVESALQGRFRLHRVQSAYTAPQDALLKKLDLPSVPNVRVASFLQTLHHSVQTVYLGSMLC